MIVQPMPPDHFPWFAERAGLAWSPGFQAIEAVDGKGRVRGMVGYDGWRPSAVCVHIALDDRLALKYLLRPAFRIPFLGWGANTLIGTVKSNNAAALELDLNLGFKEIGRVSDGWDFGVDMVILAMRRDECRWLKDRPARAARGELALVEGVA
jgi:RimJ/RimL family protein N-acetyltransferase